jgi:biopolymer transport protein ExbB
MNIATRRRQSGTSKLLLAGLLSAFAAYGILDFATVVTAQQANPDDTNSTNENGSMVGAEALPGIETAPDNPGNSGNAELPYTQGRRGLSFLQLLSRGGWFMIPLGLLSIAVVAIGVERFLSLRRNRLFPHELVHNLALLSQSPGGLDPREAYRLCQKYPSSASYIIRSMLTRVGRPQTEIENAVNESSQREAARLSHLGSWLTLVASVAPLIGLLGTVWGITQAFYDTTQLVAGQNRAEALAQGIYTALVTTICGLLIAIPAAILAHYFENKIVLRINEIEEMIYSLLPQFERYEGQVRFTTGNTAKPGAVQGVEGFEQDARGSDGQSRKPAQGPRTEQAPR